MLGPRRARPVRSGAIPNPGTTAYTYDAADELTQSVVGGATTAYSYDANGNQTAAGSRSYTYDLAGRMTATADAGVTTGYTFDGDGNRLTRSTNGTVDTRFEWDTNGDLPELALERDNAGTVLRRYVQGPAGPISMAVPTGQFTPENVYYYHRDPIGSITDVTGANGTAQWRYAYEPFGASLEATPLGAPPANPVGYTGEYTDATGDLYLRARQYTPGTGRFGALDPVTPVQTLPWVGPYTYVAGRPGVYVDPSGESLRGVVGGIGNALAAPSRRIYNHYYDASSDGVDPDSFTGNVITIMRAGEDTVDETLGAGGRALGRGAAQLTDGDLLPGLANLGLAFFDLGPGGKGKLLGRKVLEGCRTAIGLVRNGRKAARTGEALAELSAEQAANLARYTRKLPSGAGEPKVVHLPDGSVQFSTDVPGRVPGSYARYIKTIDSSGKTTGYVKETYDPTGALVQSKDKFGPGG